MIVAAAMATALVVGAALALAPPEVFLPLVGAVVGLPLLAIGAWRYLPVARRSPNVHDGLFRYLGTVSVGAGVLAVTFNGVRPLSGATLSDLLFLAGAGFLLLQLLSVSSRLPRVPLWLSAVACAILGVGLLSALFAPPVVSRTLLSPSGTGGTTFTVASNFTEDLAAAVRFSMTVVLVPMLIAFFSDSRTRLERLVDLWLVSAVLNALVGLGGSLGLSSIGDQVTGSFVAAGGREAGLTVHPNHLATIAAMAIPVAFSRATTAQGSRRRWLYWACLVIIAAGIGISGSRAGLAAGAVGGLIVLLTQRHERKKTVAGVASVAVTGVVIVLLTSVSGAESLTNVSAGFERLTGIGDVDTSSVETSNATRRATFEIALDDIAQHPLTGTGFGGVRDAHNLYLQLLQGGGVLLLCAFAVFAWGALRLGHRLSRDPRLTAGMQSLAAALVASLAVWLIAGLVQNPLYDRYLYVPLGFLLGLYLAVLHVPASRGSVRQQLAEHGLVGAAHPLSLHDRPT